MNIVATAVIEFNGGGGEDADYLAYVVLDDKSNNGKTTFNPGDTPIFLANFSDNVRIDNVISTCGNVIPKDTQQRDIVNSQVFTSNNVDDPSTYILPIIPISSSIAYDCRLGSFETKVSSCGEVKYTADTDKVPFSAKFTNKFVAKRYQLLPPELSLSEDETLNITVVFYISLV